MEVAATLPELGIPQRTAKVEEKPCCSMQALTKNPAKAATEGPHKHFFTSVNTDLSLFAASTSSGDATATTTPLSLTVSTASANSLKSFRLSRGSQQCQCEQKETI
jgi:hypothetical protein